MIPKFIPFGGEEIQTETIEQADIIVLPICHEHAPSYGAGSGKAPYHILDASLQLESFDEEIFVDWGLLNIHTLQPLFPSGSPETALDQMKQAACAILSQKKFLLSIGGDHAISLGPIMAAARLHPGLSVLQIDAHLDLRDEWNGSRYNHACVMRRVAADMGLPFVQVGIRSFSKAEAEFIQSRNLTPFYAHEIDPADDSWVGRVVDDLTDTVYITFDLDGLDPSVLPGTGTPEPGGLTYRQVLSLLKQVGQTKRVVAADINELAKIEGSHVSEFTAAKIATKIFLYCAGTKLNIDD